MFTIVFSMKCRSSQSCVKHSSLCRISGSPFSDYILYIIFEVVIVSEILPPAYSLEIVRSEPFLGEQNKLIGWLVMTLCLKALEL